MIPLRLRQFLLPAGTQPTLADYVGDVAKYSWTIGSRRICCQKFPAAIESASIPRSLI